MEEAFALTAQGVTVDVTAFPPEYAVGDEVVAAEAVLEYLDGGLPPERLTVSSDGGGCLPRFDAQGQPVGLDFATPGLLADLLADLLRRGLPLERALPPFTTSPARHLRLPDRGEVRPGAVADLVALDDDGRPHDVMARGRWHVRDGRPVVRGLFEAPAGD
jgi:beta-aspartyl-dipeptidase (metallo-type)